MEKSLLGPCIAEFIGTFALVFIGAGAICTNQLTNGQVTLVGIALAHGLALSVAISATGHISGAHFNPAVTLGFVATGRMKGSAAGAYILAQLLGAIVASLFLAVIFPPDVKNAVNLGTPGLGEGIGIGTGILVEIILTFLLIFSIFGTAVDPRAPKIGGFGIGLTVAFDILAGGPLTGASMNPARTFGPALVSGFWDGHIVYWIGPIIGGVVAALIYNSLLMEKS